MVSTLECISRTSAGIHYRIARTRQDVFGALCLVHNAYVDSGLTAPRPSGIRCTPYHLLDTTEVFVAEQDGEVVCTVSLIRDGAMGLPMEAIYDVEVRERRQQGVSVAEVSCLADQQTERSSSLRTVTKIMSLMAQCAKRRGVDELLIAVHPRHVNFYRRYIGFEPIGGIKNYALVRGNPAVALALDLNTLHIDHPAVYKRFFGKPFAESVLRYRALSSELHDELRQILDDEASVSSQPADAELACA